MIRGPAQLVIVTGLSGAGISTTLNQLEDFGFEAIDNLPTRFIGMMLDGLDRPLAVSIDIRNRDFDPAATQQQIEYWRQQSRALITILFIDCENDILIARYNQTKRRHPMDEGSRLTETIVRERAVLMPLRDAADVVIDTTQQSIWQHRQRIQALGLSLPDTTMQVRLLSFSYGRGIPRDTDLVFDVRFLRNPHYDPTLRAKDGTDTAVVAYVTADSDYVQYTNMVKTMLTLSIPRFQQEGKTYLTLAFGCTGGRHRSVTLAEEMAKFCIEQGYPVQVYHRESNK